MRGKAKKGKRKKGSSSSSNNYFNEDTERAIVAFQQEPDIEKKKQIFVSSIRDSFAKLVENIIFVYKFHTLGGIDILKNDCISFLFENLYKFDHTKGHKAFSYFNVIAKNWFIQKVKVHKKKNRSDVPFDKTAITALEKNNSELAVVSHEEFALKEEFLGLLREEIKSWRDRFDKHQEKKVLEAVILLLDNPDLISIYNKKGIYLYIREITGLNTKQVVTNLTKLKKKYNFFKRKYLAGEV
jgi:hypothetical protein